ncbi:Pc18g05670 [Penicillium rubens Wisconsin 54-1255]|uniref:Pc18g05670 protein n=1 Tax=Penicillium rubens (strain ATCC 28089 / DSM 1075 / NRRL 1951 / Wisconsin 54-1255) TaxID=500485 RepID=B6HC87_PENRW|nr:Pc18g05670 [Penicillium rubens Wisconsin 54-1255]
MRPFRTLRLPSRSTLLSQHQNVCLVPQLNTSTRTISTTQRPGLRRPLLPSNGTKTTTRAFGLPDLSSFLPNSNNSNNNNSPHRVLTATRTLPYNPALLYKVISSVEAYSQFLPFLTASTVTARDPETGYPTQAFLTVGYGPLSETFTSRVICDVEKLTVEAKSGANYGKEYLTTRWELVPVSPGAQGGPLTKVNLEVRFEFRSQMHATLMSAVEGQMAGVMIEAFEKRIREVEGKRQ